jgi:hypothetical protein
MYLTRKDDGPSIEDFLKSHKSEWKGQWKSFVDRDFKGDALKWWKSFHHSEWMSLSEDALIRSVRIKTTPRVYFHVANLYYRFMVVFIKKMSLFLLTLVASKILSIFSWLIDCKFRQRIFKAHKLQVKMLNFLKI